MTKAKRLPSTSASTNPYEGRVGLVYARVSTQRQVVEGNGLESQEGRCIVDLRRINVPHEKSFLDSYSGGGDFMNRPAMREMLAYIDANPHKKFVVVFDDLSRLARDVEFHFKLKVAFRSRDVVLKCLNYNFDESEEGEFTELIFAGKAQLDRKQNRRQVIQKMKARLEAGYFPFGGKKGYTCVKDPAHGKLFQPNEEGKVLAEAIDAFVNRSLLRKVDVCRFLVAKGFWSGQSPEKYIDKLDAILRDCFIAGDIEYERWGVSRRKGHHEGIISAETFERVQKLLKRGESTRRIRRNISPDFPLRGLLVCDDCNAPLTAGWSKKVFPYYVCHTKTCVWYGKSIRKEDIEGRFAALMQQTVLKTDVDALVETVFVRVWGQEVERLKTVESTREQERTEAETKARLLTDAIFGAKSPEVKRVYEKQLEDVAVRLQELGVGTISTTDTTIPYRTALNKAKGLLKSPYSVWCKLDVYEQHRLFYFIFESRLAHNYKSGYSTEKSSNAVRLFEDFTGVNTLDVEVGSIELPSRK